MKTTPPPAPVVAERQRFEPLPEISPPARRPPGYAPDCVIVVADTDGYTDRAMRGPPCMWTLIGAETWFYVKDFPIPERRT